MAKWSEGQWQGADLSGDYVNVGYAQACKLGLFETTPDCGHVTCGLLCDVLIGQVRKRRLTGQRGR